MYPNLGSCLELHECRTSSCGLQSQQVDERWPGYVAGLMLSGASNPGIDLHRYISP